MRQLRQRIQANTKRDAKALAGTLACRYCGSVLLADADGGWTCPRRDAHIVHGQTCEKKPHDNPSGGYLHGENDDTPYDVDGWRYCGRCHQVL